MMIIIIIINIVINIIIILLLLQMHIPADSDFPKAAVVMKQWRGTCASFSVSASTFAYKFLSVI
jgi:hypothetical protein